MTNENQQQEENVNTKGMETTINEGGAYEVLQRRLNALGEQVRHIADNLNNRRLTEFGESQMSLAGRLRIHTEQNALGCDIVQISEHSLLFGFNTFTSLKNQVAPEDVFGLYKLVEVGEGYDVQPVDLGHSFLDNPDFQRDFAELYAYYKDAKLLQLTIKDERLLAAFQIGAQKSDVRVFRWELRPGDMPSYLDARGERDLVLPPAFDFEWTRAGRDLEISGRFPHLNILDTLFIETTNGNLTIKIENNTETGEGIYNEPVEDRTQSIGDAQFDFVKVGSLILLRVLPYREKTWRGLIFNTITETITRLDAITQACIQLPEDHGIIFPGGYYLQSGEHKMFTYGREHADMHNVQFKRARRSPNGEDVLYSFYETESGKSALFIYNMIQRELQTPIIAHGYACLPDGHMVLFHEQNGEPARVHQMQIWHSPFMSNEFAAARPPSNTFWGKLGNAELVRGVSNLYDLVREIEDDDVSVQRYELLTQQTRRLFDQHHWFESDELGEECGDLPTTLHEVTQAGEAILDEFEKVQTMRAQAQEALQEAESEQQQLLRSLQPEAWNTVQEYVEALNAINKQRGRLLSIREQRYTDVAKLDTLTETLQQAHSEIAAATGRFLDSEQALAPFLEQLEQRETAAEQAQSTKELAEQLEAMQQTSADLDMLSELMTSLSVDDPHQRSRVIEAISGIYARLNQLRTRTEQRRKTLASGEVVAQFSAQFSLFTQSITSALSLSDTPEKTEDQLGRLLVQLEDLEGQFGEHEEFLGDIINKREEVLDAFESHKQALLDERQRKAEGVMTAAERILSGLSKRAERLTDLDEMNAFFATDALILKLRELVSRLRELKDNIKADDIEARLKASRDQAMRILRDRGDLFEDGGNVIKLGPRHRFGVNTQTLDLTLLPRGNDLAMHLTGTDYYAPLENSELSDLREFWSASLISESSQLCRAEYLAGEILRTARGTARNTAQDQTNPANSDVPEGFTLNLAELSALQHDHAALEKIVRDFAASRYREGYEKGIHDHDATLILRQVLMMLGQAGPLVHPPAARAQALSYWYRHPEQQSDWSDRISNAHTMQKLLGSGEALQSLRQELAQTLRQEFVQDAQDESQDDAQTAASYLIDELKQALPQFVFSQTAVQLAMTLEQQLSSSSLQAQFQQTLERLDHQGQLKMLEQWLTALCDSPQFPQLQPARHFVPEAAAYRLFGAQLPHEVRNATLSAQISGLLGEHSRVKNGTLTVVLDEFLGRIEQHRKHFLPQLEKYQTLRQQIIETEYKRLRVDEFRPKPLTSFVRNKLINDVYLPIIGDNLAKQVGTIGEGKRSDLMGLLMLISPPGYGKTTLMEYVAHRLGLVFMKINGPSLGHDVRSLDPEQAPDATARQELEKLNLALEMSNNVMLYVDDIQHTHPEFLQKFISLTDGTRRIEGVWKGETKTYDLRGRKFAVVMAGNPYTESGEVFKIPDMLANRADIYNLGEVLGGMEDVFLLSYIENCLTSNPILAPLATRDLKDVHLLVDKANGHDINEDLLSHNYSSGEISEIVGTLQHLIRIRKAVYRVNQEYITSAAQNDKYRTEPAFKLQGSYRNMNKLAEKITPVLNNAELQQLISDHYLGEAQLLTTGAEENLLKLAELRGIIDQEENDRWTQIKADFLRHKAMGSDDQDTGARVVAQLADISSGLNGIGSGISNSVQHMHQLQANQAQESANSENSREHAALEELGHKLEPALVSIAQQLYAIGQRQEHAAQTAQTHASSDLHDTLHTTLHTVLEGLVSPLVGNLEISKQQQMQTNAAIEALTDVIRQRQPSQQRQTTPQGSWQGQLGREGMLDD